jgi:hypothetical protein
MFTIVLLIAVPVIGLAAIPGAGTVWLAVMVFAPLVILFAAAFFMIRGYELTGSELFIKRLGWKSTLNLQNLQHAEVDPEAMKRSIRLFGNGGLFCFAGQFRNKKLGRYRAYATDHGLAVVLRFTDKVVVVTPGAPDRFVEQINRIE